MDAYFVSDDSEEEPQVLSSKTSLDQHTSYENNRLHVIKKQKDQLKDIRRERHEKNKLQKNLKKQKFEKLEYEQHPQELDPIEETVDAEQRLNDLESKKLPEELLELVKVQKKNAVGKIKEINLKKKKLSINKKAKFANKNDYLGVFVKVLTLDKEVEKANPIASKAVDFRKEALYNNKTIKRIPSRNLRVMQQKQKFCRS